MNPITSGQAEGDVDRIVRERFFPRQSSGVLVEVGAARPDYLSISALYRSLGWKVLAIDPNPAYAEQYQRLGLELLQYACAENDADDVDFTVVDSHETKYRGGAVTFESFSSLGVRGDFATLKPNLDTTTIKVKVRSLDAILKAHAPSVERVDILSVDVEGWELEVLRGLDFARFRPKVVILENLFYTASYRQFMTKQGYTLWRLIAPNEVWVRRELTGSVERVASWVAVAALTARWQAARAVNSLLRA
jgi:FkbM family methyltransferase